MRGRALLLLLALAPAGLGQDAEETVPQGQFREQVNVDRVLLDLRIVDAKGAPILGLGPDDLRVEVDGAATRVESLRWISGTTPYAEGLTPEQAWANGVEAAPAGRMLVFFFQKDLDPSRSAGLLRMKTEAIKLLASLKAEDRVAVASFDTRLRLWTDFTTDRKRLRHIIERRMLFDQEPRELLPNRPSMLADYDYRAALDAATPEQGFIVLAKALHSVPGTKSLAFFGWGLGRSSGGGVSMVPEYGRARQALVDARVVVFSLDLTNADYHTMQVGLETLAADTGGFYAKTHDFPNLAMARLESALQGYYALSFVKPALPRGRHDVAVDVVGGKGSVLISATYVD